MAKKNIGLSTSIQALQSRIAELEAENAEIKHVEKRFKEWFCEDNCPLSQHDICLGGEKERYETEQLKLAEEDRFDFDREYDCEEEMQGRCWAKYYRKEWRDKQ